MLKPLLSCLLVCLLTHCKAQTNDKIYGVVTRNYYSNVSSPFHPNGTIQRLDSSTIRIGRTDGPSGVVTNIGTVTYNRLFSITGAAVDPYQNKFVITGPNGLLSFDLSSGLLVNEVPLQNVPSNSYFDNFRINQADSTIYGLARGSYIDSTTPGPDGEVFLAKANTQTGVITRISPASVAPYFTVAGSAIDPHQMVYYFITRDSLMGLDIYDGTVRSHVPIVLPANTYFDNFTYSCADSSIYGLVRQNFVSYVYNPLSVLDSMQRLDSTSVKLGKIDPATGIVTIISPVSLTERIYTLNASSAIDPNTLTYYYGTPTNLVGVSLATGFITSNAPITLTDGNFFNLLRSFENCRGAEIARRNPALPPLPPAIATSDVRVYPNPSSNSIIVKCNQTIRSIAVADMNGRVLLQQTLNARQTNLDISRLMQGIYSIRVQRNDGQISVQRFVKN